MLAFTDRAQMVMDVATVTALTYQNFMVDESTEIVAAG